MHRNEVIGVLGHDSALYGYTGPGTTWAIMRGYLLWIMSLVQDRLLAWPVDQQSCALPLCLLLAHKIYQCRCQFASQMLWWNLAKVKCTVWQSYLHRCRMWHFQMFHGIGEEGRGWHSHFPGGWGDTITWTVNQPTWDKKKCHTYQRGYILAYSTGRLL